MKPIFLLITLFFFSDIAFSQSPTYRPNDEERILVLSGGGARGAWGGGLTKTLCKEYNYKYKYVVGNSTGSLLAPLVLISEFDRLEDAYTSIRQKDIFKGKSPFYTKGRKKGNLRTGKAFFKILLGTKTLGNSKNLKKTIRKFFTRDFYERIKNHPEGKAFIATVLNFSLDQIEYKSSDQFTYDQMVDWMWASANQPVFMSLFVDESTDYAYVDGGSKENVPILKAVELANANNIRHIDVVVHNTEKPGIEPAGKMKIIEALFRTVSILTNDVKENDIFWAKVLNQVELQTGSMFKMNEQNSIEINVYFMSELERQEIPQTLLFEKDRMSRLWDYGEQFFDRIDHQNYIVKYKIPAGLPFQESIRENKRVEGN